MRQIPESAKKKKIIEDYLNKPLEIGQEGYVYDKEIIGLSYSPKEDDTTNVTIVGIEGDNISISCEKYRDKKILNISSKLFHSSVLNVGPNPFIDDFSNIRSINYSLESILFTLDLLPGSERTSYNVRHLKTQELNMNPYVIIEGKKQFYQRPLVWKLKDKQNLIDSIYNFVDCGKILIRNRSWKELEEMVDRGDEEIFFKDMVDGKQRLSAVAEFINNGFKDSYGNYYSDLSFIAQIRLLDHQLFSYSELPENSKDETVLKQFLRLNFAGVPQSKEHIKFIKSLLK